jgi:hypothetical protein
MTKVIDLRELPERPRKIQSGNGGLSGKENSQARKVFLRIVSCDTVTAYFIGDQGDRSAYTGPAITDLA